MNFSANWPTRALRAAVTAPNVAFVTLPLGLLNCAWLNTLKKLLVGPVRLELTTSRLKIGSTSTSGTDPGTGVEDRTPLILFVGQAPSPDDNPGIVSAHGVGPW